MMPRLKRLRLAVGMTQADVAKAMGMSQPNYQRWESGAARIPQGKLKKLARTLGTSITEILGNPPAFDRLGIDQSVGDDRTYFGEVAIHFIDQNAILLPISEAEREQLHHQFLRTSPFIVAESLDNRIVFMRRDAIADVYFSSDAYDNRGPEAYPDFVGVFPDDRFWQIVEYLDSPDTLNDSFEENEVQSVIDQIGLDSSSGDDSAQDRETGTGSDGMAQRFFDRAANMNWQLSFGRSRQEYVVDDTTLFDTFEPLQDADEPDDMILLPLGGYHRTILIRESAVDYISIPKQRFNAGRNARE